LVSFLVVLLLIATTSKAASFKLINNGTWAKNFPGIGRPPLFTTVSVDDNFASVYERWEVETFEEGVRIRNDGTGFWLTARNGEVGGSSEFDPAASKWFIEGGGEGKFKISVPNEDLVMTTDRGQPDSLVTLFLRPADGSPAQLWSFESIRE